MTLDPLVVGSIKDRVLCAVIALGESATRAAIRKSVECASSVLEIAIDGLHRDGYLYVHERGHFAVDDDYASTLKLAEHGKVTTAQSATPTIQQAARCTPMSTKTICKKCGAQKQQFGPCPACGAKRREARDNGKPAETAPARETAKPARKKSVRSVTASDPHVIPASGEIRCRIQGLAPFKSAVLAQFDQEINLSIEQLRALRDWANSALDQAAG